MAAASEDMLDQLCTITGLERSLAANLLEACGHNLEMALNMHMEEGDQQQQQQQQAPPSQQQQQLEEGDGVRAPIPQKQETLVQAGYEGYQMNNRVNRVAHQRNRVRSVFDGFRNFEAEARRLEEGGGSEQQQQEPAGYSRSKKRTLEELFKPPLDIMHQEDWQSTRDHAVNTNRWLLVNIQDPKEFQCQVLNRDLWSNPGVKTIIREHFVFWQQYKESDEAERYMTFYRISQWPYIAIIDPRTGENMVTWTHIEAEGFPELITEFLSLHPTLDSPAREPPRKKLRPADPATDRIAEMDEEAQLAAAIRASLEETLQKKSAEQEEEEEQEDQLTADLSSSDGEDGGEVSRPQQRLANGHHTTLNGHHDETDAAGTSQDSSKAKAKTTVTDRVGNTGECSKDRTVAVGKGEVKNGEAGGWEAYLGRAEDPSTNILIRYPDGRRDAWRQPATSQLRALVLFLAGQGYGPEHSYELVTNFPRRVLSDLDLSASLRDHGLFPQETVFVQLRD